MNLEQLREMMDTDARKRAEAQEQTIKELHKTIKQLREENQMLRSARSGSDNERYLQLITALGPGYTSKMGTLIEMALADFPFENALLRYRIAMISDESRNLPILQTQPKGGVPNEKKRRRR